MSTPEAPAVEGWFSADPEPHLIGTRCKQCETYYFPKQTDFCRNPDCFSSDFDEVPLSRTGKVWSYTKHFYQPPEPYIVDGEFEPYTIVGVELAEEKMMVLGQLAADADESALKAGIEMELVIEKLYHQDGTDYTVWKWKPVAS